VYHITKRNKPIIKGGDMVHKIIIKKVINGLKISIGCAEFVSEDIDKAMGEIARYLKNPKNIEKEYLKKYDFSDIPEVPQEAFRDTPEVPQKALLTPTIRPPQN
jgi:hypothetical protein